MTDVERSGITIVIDTGKRREIVNVPTAEDVDIETIVTEPTEFRDPRHMFTPAPELKSIRLSFKPIGPITIKREDLP